MIRLFCFVLLASMLMAGEHHGSVTGGSLPIPGAVVTATKADEKKITTTDDAGAFTLTNLSDGEWTVEVKMLGFAPLRRAVVVAPNSTQSKWEMTFLSKENLMAALNPGGPPRTARPKPVEFRRVEVAQAAEPQAFGEEGAIRGDDMASLNQSAENSFLVQGSVSSAAGLPQQNDWGFGPPGGMMAGGMMPGGMMPGMQPGMPLGMSGAPDGPDGMPAQGPAQQQGPRGPGGPGGMAAGGFGGGRGMGPGMGPGGGGGFGGRGGPPPGGRRPGGPGAGPNRPDWQRRAGATAFGNNRRRPGRQYNGMAMFGLNDSIWDARVFSVTGAAVDKPDYSNARGSVMFGGPLRIPKLVSAERQIMFTLNYQFARNRTGTVSDPVNMPTALERLGDFSQTVVGGAPVTIFDPLTNAPFANNRIPASRINPTSAALLNFFPEPNLPFAVRNYQTSWLGVNDTHNISARVMNVRITPKDRLNGSIAYQNSSNEQPNIFQFIDSGSGTGINASLGWSRNISGTITNNMQFAFSRMRQQSTPFFADVRNVAAELGIAGTSAESMNWGPPTLQFVNYASLSNGNFSLGRNQTLTLGETLIVVRGPHTVSFGGNYRRFHINQLADTNGRGTWSFNGAATGGGAQGSGYDLADFLLGMPTTSSIRFGNPDKYFRNSGYDLFVNDDWRMHPRFTLNFGVRWDYTTPVSELYDRMVNLALTPDFTQATPSPASTGTLLHPDRNNFSPRLGFAWRPSTKRSTVVRGGYGVYYNTSVYNAIAANMAQQPPFASVLNVSSSPASPLFLDDGFSLGAAGASLPTYAIDPYYRIGYAQTWQISVQRDLALGMFGTIGYLGTKGTRLDQQFLPNSVAPGATPVAAPQGFLYQTSNGNSTYHALQLQLNRRFRSGLGWGSSYQFSKSIDNAGTGGRGQGGTPVAQNWLDYSAERGLSSFDSRHNLSVNAQYSTGMGRAGGTLVQGWKGALLKDWTISSMLTLRSGNPFTATVGGSRSQVVGTAVSNTVRANATGLPIAADGMLFNTAAFAAPAPGEWGNAGRNTIPGPTTMFLNGGVGRVFRLGERRSVDIQMQGQNVLNRVVITRWGTVLGANNFGLAANAATMRRITLNVRFRF